MPAHINTWQQETQLSFVPQACSKLYAPNTKRTRVHWSLYQEVPYFNVLLLEATQMQISKFFQQSTWSNWAAISHLPPH